MTVSRTTSFAVGLIAVGFAAYAALSDSEYDQLRIDGHPRECADISYPMEPLAEQDQQRPQPRLPLLANGSRGCDPRAQKERNLSMVKTMLIAATAALFACTTATAQASSTGIPSAPNAGPSCTKFTVGGHTYAIDTTDKSANSDGRLAALSDAFLKEYPVNVFLVSELGVNANIAPQVLCNGLTNEGFDAPALIQPAQ